MYTCVTFTASHIYLSARFWAGRLSISVIHAEGTSRSVCVANTDVAIVVSWLNKMLPWQPSRFQNKFFPRKRDIGQI